MENQQVTLRQKQEIKYGQVPDGIYLVRIEVTAVVQTTRRIITRQISALSLTFILIKPAKLPV